MTGKTQSMSRAASEVKEGQRMQKSQTGFSLIELLIVVAIILIIAAIAIPNLLRSRIAANEASAVGALRTIITGQVTYAGQYPAVGYAATLLVLGPPAGGAPPDQNASDIIDDTLASGFKSGYGFQSTGATDGCNAPDAAFTNTTAAGLNVTFEIYACPASQNRTGIRNFCTSDGGTLRQGADPVTVCDFTVASPPVS